MQSGFSQGKSIPQDQMLHLIPLCCIFVVARVVFSFELPSESKCFLCDSLSDLLCLTELTRGSSLCLEQLLARLLIYLVLGPLRVSENWFGSKAWRSFSGLFCKTQILNVLRFAFLVFSYSLFHSSFDLHLVLHWPQSVLKKKVLCFGGNQKA